MVKLLLSRGANINAFDKKDRRAIHWAAYMGKIVVMWGSIIRLDKPSVSHWPYILLAMCANSPS